MAAAAQIGPTTLPAELQANFPEDEVKTLILQWQLFRDYGTWQQILTACTPLIEKLISLHDLRKPWQTVEDLREACRNRLFQAARNYRPNTDPSVYACVTSYLQHVAPAGAQWSQI